MAKSVHIIIFLLILLEPVSGQFNIGVARKSITPETPVWLTGYASRTEPSTEVLHDLWAKALVIEDNKKSKIIIVTTDILGLSRDISQEVIRRIKETHGTDRSRILLNSSHTHSGPVIWPSLSIIFDFDPEEQKAAMSYAEKLTDAMVEVVNMAVASMEPMKLSYGQGIAGFAVNRRQSGEKGIVIGVNPGGPVDHTVPVLKAEDRNGNVKAILFGYTCHNTTSRSYLINGDYSGFAQLEIEKMYPGAIAWYMAGCGADLNPHPRGTI